MRKLALVLLCLLAAAGAAARQRGGAVTVAYVDPSITTTSPLPAATVGSAYSDTISATGGTTPYTWSITGCSPCTGGGWSIGSSTGVLANSSPSTAETETIDIEVTDNLGHVGGPVAFSLTVNSSGGGPAIVTAAYENQGSTGCENAGSGTGCTTDTADLYWQASSGATDYPLLVNGSQVADPSSGTACSGSNCHYTLTVANLNCVNTYCQEALAQFGIEAHNSSGTSAAVNPGNYSYQNGSGPATGNSCGNYSGGGFGSYMGTSVLAATFVSGSKFANITTASGTYNGTVYPYQGFTDGSGAIENSAATGGVGNPYFYPFGTGGQSVTVNSLSPSNGAATSATLSATWNGPTGTYTLTLSNAAVAASITLTNGSATASWSVAVSGATGAANVTGAGTGSTGTYYMSAAAIGNATADWIEGQPSATVGGGNGAEACPQTQVAESPHTYALSEYSIGDNYMQQYVGATESPGYDANWSGYSCWGMDIYPTTNHQILYGSIHTRPGTAGSDTGDLYSTRYLELLNGTSSAYVSGGTITPNAWNHLCVPLSALGVGSGTISAYVTSSWHGTGSVTSAVLTIDSTLDGNASSIAVNDYVSFHSSSGWGCFEITSIVTAGTTYDIASCPQGGTANQSGVEMYDANLYVQSVTSGVGPDNGGIITGQGEPTGTFLGGAVIGFSGTPNPTGVAQYGLYTGTSAQIVAAGTGSGGVCTSGCVTFGDNRYSIYKPEVFFKDTSGFQVTFFDNMGGTAN